MRIVFNLLSTLKAKTGVGHYAARLFAALAAAAYRPTLCTASRPGHWPRWCGDSKRDATGGDRRPHRPLESVARLAKELAAAKRGRGCLGLAFRAACRRGNFDLYHEPNFIPLAGGVPAVVTVHDLSVLLHPEWHPADRVRHHERRFRQGLAPARHIITVSRVRPPAR